MKTNRKKAFGTALLMALLSTATTVWAQDVTIRNNGKTTSIRTDGGNVSVDTDEDGKARRKTRVSTGKSSGDRSGSVNVLQNGQELVYDLDGESMNVKGNNNNIVVRGNCGNLNVNGNGNVITIESVGAINAMGNQNKVSWRKGNPSVNNIGSKNVVSRQ